MLRFGDFIELENRNKKSVILMFKSIYFISEEGIREPTTTGLLPTTPTPTTEERDPHPQGQLRHQQHLPGLDQHFCILTIGML